MVLFGIVVFCFVVSWIVNGWVKILIFLDLSILIFVVWLLWVCVINVLFIGSLILECIVLRRFKVSNFFYVVLISVKLFFFLIIKLFEGNCVLFG